MGPKKREITIDNEYMWRQAIEDAPLDEDNWSVKVIMIEAASSDQDRIYLSKFEAYAAQEKRFVVKNICKTETVFMINQLGSDKKVKDDTLRVFEEGNSYLKDKKDIPPDVYALIIKHLILKMKQEYLFIKSQKLDVQEGMRIESAIMVNKAEFKGTVNTANVIDLEDKHPTNMDGKKYNTTLRERGEQWRDKIYVDDYPMDGPNLYVAITGFVEPFLPGCLIKIGIPLTSVVQIRIDPTANQVPTGLNRATKRGQSHTELLTKKSLTFWNNMQLLRTQTDTANALKNTAFIIFSPPYFISDNLSGEPNKIYDELCYLMYDIQDLSRQHIHYLNNMEIVNLPEEQFYETDKTYYNELINSIPLESITIYSVLDSILSAVCKNINLNDLSHTRRSSLVTTLKNVPTANKEYINSETLVKDVFNTLCEIENNKKQYRFTHGEMYENHKDPIIIKYGDFAKYKTFHLGNINLDQIVFSSLLGMPVYKLWDMQNRLTGKLEAKVNFHMNVLLSSFDREDVQISELNRLLNILACRKLYSNRSSLTKQQLQSTTIKDLKKKFLKRSILVEPLPSCRSLTQIATLPSIFLSATKTANESITCSENNQETLNIKYLFDCPDISELVSASEIANNQHNIEHIIEEFAFFEDFAGSSAFQIVSQAFNQFNCINYKYCEVTDSFILMFFNSHDNDGIARDEWRCHLSTPVCLQDFFDYILEEHHDWIQKEEKLYDENLVLKAQSESKLEIDHSVLIPCIADTEVDTDLLIEGSLKHDELLQRAANIEKTEIIETYAASNVLQAIEQSKSSSRKTKSRATISPKSIRQSLDTPSSALLTGIEKLSKPFLGYNLGDRRVEVFGKDAKYFSRDGTKISSAYTLIIPTNVEYIHLNIRPGNSYNEFTIHKVFGESVTPDIIDCCESFRITSKDQVMINIKKQVYMAPVDFIKSPSLNNFKSKNQSKSDNSEKFHTSSIEYDTKHLHSLYLTWPNGMITETIYENNSAVLSHIKQYHVCQMSAIEEDMRCISMNGEVIIFKNCGDIEVLRPDGSYIKITKCYKRQVISTNLEEKVEDSSYKIKKIRSDRSSKTSSKSSKNVILEDEKVSDDKNPQYELIIDEFEIIETSGLRKRYVNNIPIIKEKLLIRTASDYCIGEMFSRRNDGTTTLITKDGIHVVTFPNKTRIITYCVFDDNEIHPEWTAEEKQYLGLFKHKIETENSSQRSSHESDSGISKIIEEEESKGKGGEESMERTDGYILIHVIYTVEHFNFSTITINKATEKISIESPNGTTVVVGNNNDYNITLDDVTTASFDGNKLNILYEACPACKAFTICNIRIIPDEGKVVSVDNNHWVNIKDSFNKNVVVNDEGSIVVVKETTGIIETTDVKESPPVLSDLSSEMPAYVPILQENIAQDNFGNINGTVLDTKSEALISHGKCREIYLAKTIRFFILKRDLNCSELIHRALVERYKSECRWQPWCSVSDYKTFGDYRSLVSIITPVHRAESEKWLMDSKLADKPKYLTYKDLKEDTGKGFYQWMRPYKRFKPKPIKPENVLPPRLPRAFVLRILEQQWGSADRVKLCGAKELLKAILRYRTVIENNSQTLLNTSIVDPRPEKERCFDDLIQNLAHKIYQKLRSQLAEHVENSTRAGITTKPSPSSSAEKYIEAEQFGEESTTASGDEKHRNDLVKQFSQAEEVSPNLRKYWRRRAEELKEEEFYKYLLRDGNVPPYFQNVLGGAMWWDMNYAAGEAVTKSERCKTKCECTDSTEGDEAADYCSSYTVPKAS